MSQNMLVDRLKFAKRELTALKTAHTRGLGLLKIYKTEFDYSQTGKPDGYIYNAVVTVKFSRDFAAYPFAYVLGDINRNSGIFWPSFEAEVVSFKDSGYTLVVSGRAVYATSENLRKVTAVSTAPIISLTCNLSSL